MKRLAIVMIGSAALALGPVLVAGVASLKPALAQSMSDDELIRKLMPIGSTLSRNSGVMSKEIILHLPPVNSPPRPSVVRPQTPGPSADFHDISFDLDSAVIRPSSLPVLQQIVRVMNSPELSRYRFSIIGHTDAVGSAEYNLALSQRRAQSVVTFLLGAGIAHDRLEYHGEGKTNLKDPANPSLGVNRRVEVRTLQ